MEFVLLSLLMNENHDFYYPVFLRITWYEQMFTGIISGKPSRDFTRPLGSHRGLKGLLHTLNAIVHPMKE
jgi:hypothetical protein